MAICNLFRALSKNTGNILMFSQYSEDLTQCYVQHDNYDVMPSRFVALNIDYKKLEGFTGTKWASTRYKDLNKDLPLYLQNYFENGCAWLRGNIIGDAWTPDKWTPDVHSNMFWNALAAAQLIKIEEKATEDEHGETLLFDTFPQVKYVGDIDIHSYEARDGVGYSEVYCYIPNDAAESYYQVFVNHKDHTQWSYMESSKEYLEGYDEEAASILGVLNPKLSGATRYYHEQNFSSVFTKPMETPSNEAIESRVDYQIYPTHNDSFEFNTIVVLYDVMVKDADGNITTAYTNVPLGMYLTGKINKDGSVTNKVLKYTTNDDAYGAGTSYGLRICTRYMVTPNATTINNVELDVCDQYAGFSKAMDEMAKSQVKMNEIITRIVDSSQNIKDQLMQFKNYRANIPYIVWINEAGENRPYWFINGKNTGVLCNGNTGERGRDGVTPQIAEWEGKKYWYINGENTGVIAEGVDGMNGFSGTYWFSGNILDFDDIDGWGGSPVYPGESMDGVPEGAPDVVSCRAFSHDGIWEKEGDFYVNTYTKDVYILRNFMGDLKWQKLFSLKGDRGLTGHTPYIQENNGVKYWYVNGENTNIIAEGKPGNRILCLDDMYYTGGVAYFLTDSCNPEDLVLYVGDVYPSNSYNIYSVSDESVDIDGKAYYRAQRNGNLLSPHITNIAVAEGKKSVTVTVNLSDGNTISYKHKKFVEPKVQYSNIQRNYVCWGDVIHYTPSSELYVEIPYKYNIKNESYPISEYGIEPLEKFQKADATYKYIVKGGSLTKGQHTGGYKVWNSDVTIPLYYDNKDKLEKKYGKNGHLGSIHLYMKWEDYCELFGKKYGNNGIVWASYDLKNINSSVDCDLVWNYETKSDYTEVERHTLKIKGQTWIAEPVQYTQTNIQQLNSLIEKKKYAEALTLFKGLCNKTTPVYEISTKQKVYAKVWVKTMTCGHKKNRYLSRKERELPKNTRSWRWFRDWRSRSSKTKHMIDWNNILGLFASSKLKGKKNRKSVPYLYVVLYDGFNSNGYLYKITTNDRKWVKEFTEYQAVDLRDPKNVTESDLKILYQGTVSPLKRTK